MTRMANVTAEVILALDDYPEGRTLSELAESLERSTSSVQRALLSLTRDGVVIKEAGAHPRFRLNQGAPLAGLKQVARWSLPTARTQAARGRSRGLAARRKAAVILRRLAPDTAASTWVPSAVERVVERFNPVRIILFGSQSRGEARWDSDFDFLVVLPDAADPRRSAIEVRRALKDLPIAKDVLVISQRDIQQRQATAGTALAEALTNGLAVYERR